MYNIVAEVRSELKKYADPEVQASGQRFFKEEVKLYGLKSALVRKIGENAFRRIRNQQKSEIFNYCEEFFQSGFLEESIIACNWSYLLAKEYLEEDLDVFEKWLNNYVHNWATCDTLCNHAIGAFIEMYPAYIEELKKWARSGNRWMRRGSAVSLIIPARKGKFLKDIFQIADILMLDKDDLVQKGYGWMLKAASEANKQQVFDYVIRNKESMPRTALRYAVEKMPKEWKETAMRKN